REPVLLGPASVRRRRRPATRSLPGRADRVRSSSADRHAPAGRAIGRAAECPAPPRRAPWRPPGRTKPRAAGEKTVASPERPDESPARGIVLLLLGAHRGDDEAGRTRGRTQKIVEPLDAVGIRP